MAEIAEALRLVDEAVRREAEERARFESLFAGVDGDERSPGPSNWPSNWPSSGGEAGGGGEGSGEGSGEASPPHRHHAAHIGPLGAMGASYGPGGAPRDEPPWAERQLAALMELGFHAELAAPLCDGVSPVEGLVEQLMEMQISAGAGAGGHAPDRPAGRGGASADVTNGPMPASPCADRWPPTTGSDPFPGIATGESSVRQQQPPPQRLPGAAVGRRFGSLFRSG